MNKYTKYSQENILLSSSTGYYITVYTDMQRDILSHCQVGRFLQVGLGGVSHHGHINISKCTTTNQINLAPSPLLGKAPLTRFCQMSAILSGILSERQRKYVQTV